MDKRLTITIPNSKVLKFDSPDIKNILNSEKKVKKNSESKESPLKFISFLKQQRRNSVTTLNPIDEVIEGISKDLKMAQSNDYKEDIFLANFLIEKAKYNFINGRKIKLVEIIFHILKKNQKNDNEILILKLYFLKMEKLVSLLLPLKINISDMLVKLVCQIKCEKKNKNTILFKYGDIGEKLYILLKGNVGILITKEKNIECTPLEFIKYLILLHLYQEESLLYETISKNKHIINIEEKQIICLLHIFKFYYFLQENKRLTKNYNSIFDFIQNEQNINYYISKKYNYSTMLSLEILNYGRTTIEHLYDFYSRKIKEISKSLRFGLTGSALIATFIKRQIKPSLANKPQTQEELLNYLKVYDEGKKKFKNEDEYYQKISYINEISHNKILSTTEEKYIQRLDADILLESIKQDTKTNYNPLDLINEQNIKYKVFIYYEINQLFDGNIFGELALSDPTNKRSATVITKDDCFFGTLIKQVYDLSLKSAQEKLRLRNVLFFTRGPIFKGISNNIFLNKFFYTFKKKIYRNGDILFNKGEERKSILFVVKGELELSRNMTMAEITNIINSLGGILDDKYLTFLCNTYYQLHKFYYNHKHNIKFCVLKDKEIIGLDDLTIDDMNIFDCKCVSTEKTELYEIDYNTFKEAKKYIKIRDNIIDFVNNKRNLFIKILLEQRNALISNELNKIKKSQLKNNNLNEDNNPIIITKNLFLPITKNVRFTNKQIILSYNQKNKYSEDFLLLRNKNSKSLQKTEKSKNLYTLSTGDVDYEKNSHRLDIKNFTLSRKDNKNNVNLLSTIKNYNIKDNNIIKNKNQKNLKIKKSFFNRNSTFSDNNYYSINNYTQLTNDKKIINNLTYFSKTYKPVIKKIYHSRTRKKLVPFLSYSHSKKVKGGVTPLFLKEYQKKFPELRNNINTNNFFLENQNIFESLLNNENNNNFTFISKITRDKNINNKNSLNNKNIIYSYNSKNKEKNCEKNCEESKNNINNNNNNENLKISSKGNQTEINFYPKKKRHYYREGIIDCLCLDNWEEKDRFQKILFSE